jgi:protein CpxP
MKHFTQNKFLVLLVALLLIANLGVMLYFFAFRNHHAEERPHPVSDYIQKELGFNADQAAKFQQLRDQHKQAIKPVIDEMKRLKDSLYGALQKRGMDDSAANELAKKIGEKQQEWEMMIFHHFQKVRAICDTSQIPKLDTLVHRMVDKWPHMRKKESH